MFYVQLEKVQSLISTAEKIELGFFHFQNNFFFLPV